MRIQVISDVHVEFHRDGGRSFVESLDPTGVDVVVVAGDLGTLHTITPALEMFCGVFPEVVYVTGNHEYYQSSWKPVEDRLGALAARVSNFHWLNDTVVVIGGQRFVGGTLWFDRDERGHYYRREMNDFGIIAGFEPEVYERNARTVAFLEGEVRAGDVVVTHHLPSERSIDPKYARSPLNAYFCHDMSGLIERAKPLLWVHGHTHESCDYVQGSTRVVCNPFGYVGYELNRRYVERLVVEV